MVPLGLLIDRLMKRVFYGQQDDGVVSFFTRDNAGVARLM